MVKAFSYTIKCTYQSPLRDGEALQGIGVDSQVPRNWNSSHSHTDRGEKSTWPKNRLPFQVYIYKCRNENHKIQRKMVSLIPNCCERPLVEMIESWCTLSLTAAVFTSTNWSSMLVWSDAQPNLFSQNTRTHIRTHTHTHTFSFNLV